MTLYLKKKDMLHNKYIFKTLLSTLIVTTLTLTIMIWLMQIGKFSSYIENGVSLLAFLKLSILLFPPLLLLIVPLALFFAILSGYTKLIANNEIAVLRGAGISKMSLAKPAITLAILSTIFCYTISFYFAPMAEQSLRTIRSNANNDYAMLLLEKGKFNHVKDITVYVDEKDADGTLEGILIYDNRIKYDSNIVSANSGVILRDKGGEVHLSLNNGVMQTKDKTLHFDSYLVNLSEYDQNNKIDLKLSEKSTQNLFKSLKSKSKKSQEIFAELHNRISFPLLSFSLSIIALSSILCGTFSRYGNRFNIITAIVVGSLFLIIEIILKNMVVIHSHIYIPLYLHFFIFPVLARTFIRRVYERLN